MEVADTKWKWRTGKHKNKQVQFADLANTVEEFGRQRFRLLPRYFGAYSLLLMLGC